MSRNERITEEIVRDHLKKSFHAGKIEEQQPQSLQISKLLKIASKSGLGIGKPEFIISEFQPPYHDLIIVIECKADVQKHESRNLDKPKDYAVDGVLLYSSYLSKGFDVLSIAVSGQHKEELKVSNYLQLKGSSSAHPIEGNQLESLNSYFDKYLHDESKFNTEYGNILSYSKELNEKLHTLQVAENHRALLISAMLIALSNEAFRNGYESYKKGEHLASALITAVSNELRDSIQKEKAEKVITTYSFIRTHTQWEEDVTSLRELIRDVDIRINSFIKTYQYYDILGQFYIEFLRYANMDKSLGIVLTPPHITDLFAHLANVNKDSKVYDSCCGTGGFLISAMQQMIKDAKGNKEKILSIKRDNLIGVEFKDHIYTLAVSNMFMHGDGKTQIVNGSCFDPKVKNFIRNTKPSVGFLNPPYKAEKDDIEEIQFIIENLDCLEKGGSCVAIIPLERCLAVSGKNQVLKEQILKNHTLEGVFSMPDALFYNSKVGVITCVIVITAHIPHPAGKKTYFGFWKEDGFSIQRHRGRIPMADWKSIQQNWIQDYRNRVVKPGVSVMREVTSTDEWCAEAYMETDYTILNKESFIKELKRYAAFNMMSDM